VFIFFVFRFFGAKRAMAFSGTQQKCKACDKTVYLVEQLTADGVIYHKSCFRCNHCKGTLKLGNYASLEGVLYCRPHFEQLLKTTGSFDKSFDTKTGTEVVKKLPSDKQEVQSPLCLPQ
jgi:cysteine/glycine-rich protein